MSYKLYRVSGLHVFTEVPISGGSGTYNTSEVYNHFFEEIPLQYIGRAGIDYTTYRLGLISIGGHSIVNGESNLKIGLLPYMDFADVKTHLAGSFADLGWTVPGDSNNFTAGVAQRKFRLSAYAVAAIRRSGIAHWSGAKDYTSNVGVMSGVAYQCLTNATNINADFEYRGDSININITSHLIYEYMPSVSIAGGGVFTKSINKPAAVFTGETSSIVFTPSADYEFVGWQVGGAAFVPPANVALSNGNRTITYRWDALAADVGIVAVVRRKPQTLTVSISPSPAPAGCSVSRSLEPVDGYYDNGAVVDLTAVRGTGYILAAWSKTDAGGTVQILRGDAGFSETLRVVMSSDVAVTAYFEERLYGVTVDVDAPSNGQGSASLKYIDGNGAAVAFPPEGVVFGSTVRLSATAGNLQNHFAGWFKGGILFSSNATLDVYVSDDAAYTAKFGGTFAVNKAQKLGDTGVVDLGAVTAGVVVGDAVQASAAFTYGETIRIRAVGMLGAIFTGWHDIYLANTQTAQRLDLRAESDIVPTATGSITAVFSSVDVPYYVRLTNSGANYATLSLASESVQITELTMTQYVDALTERSGQALPIDGNQTNNDKYYRIVGSGSCVLTARLFSTAATFSKWGIAPIVYTSGAAPAVGTAADFSATAEASIEISSDCVFFASYNSGDPSKVVLDFSAGSNATMGDISMQTHGGNYFSTVPIHSDFPVGSIVSINATAKNGFRFAGWFQDGILLSASPEHSFTVSSSGVFLYIRAMFEMDNASIFTWEGSQEVKQTEWTSKRFVAAVPFNPSSARVLADAYPVELEVRVASSPNGFSERRLLLLIPNQNPIRLPLMRKEKYLELTLRGTSSVLQAAVSTSMEGV